MSDLLLDTSHYCQRIVTWDTGGSELTSNKPGGPLQMSLNSSQPKQNSSGSLWRWERETWNSLIDRPSYQSSTHKKTMLVKWKSRKVGHMVYRCPKMSFHLVQKEAELRWRCTNVTCATVQLASCSSTFLFDIMAMALTTFCKEQYREDREHSVESVSMKDGDKTNK